MPVGALDIHVVEAVVGAIVLHAGARAQPAAPLPSVARARSARRLAERALIGLMVEAVDGTLAAARVAPPDRCLVRRQFRQPRAEAGIDIFVEHLGAGIDVGVDIVDAESAFHAAFPSRFDAPNIAPAHFGRNSSV